MAAGWQYCNTVSCTWTPKVCEIMAFKALIRGLGLLFYILLGFRYDLIALPPGNCGFIGY